MLQIIKFLFMGRPTLVADSRFTYDFHWSIG